MNKHKGSIGAVALVLGALALLGVVSISFKLPPLGSGGEEVPVAVSSGDQTFVTPQLSVTGTGTSTFTGGVSAASLASSAGLTVTGGSILATNIGAVFGSTTVTGITSAGGITLTGGCLSVNGACVSSTISGSGANTRVAFWSGASSLSSNASFVWTDAAARLSVTLGSTTDSHSIGNLLTVSGTGTSTFSGGISISTAGGLSSASGITVTGGSILATNIGASLGSTTVTGLSSSGGISISAGCYLGANGACVGAATANDVRFLKQTVANIATETIGVTGLPACEFYEVVALIPTFSTGSNGPRLLFDHPNGAPDHSAAYTNERDRLTAGVSTLGTDQSQDGILLGGTVNGTTQFYDIFVSATTTVVRQVTWSGSIEVASAATAGYSVVGAGAYHRTTGLITSIFLGGSAAASTSQYSIGTSVTAYGRRCT